MKRRALLALGASVVSTSVVSAAPTAPRSSGSSAPPAPRVPPPPPPQQPFAVELLVLHATNTKRGIDPRLKDLPELSEPPFSSYDSYALLERARVPLEQATPKPRRLPNGRMLAVRLVEAGADFVRLAASINQPGGKDFLPLLEVKAKVGERFIVAGQSYKSGILVLVFKVVK